MYRENYQAPYDSRFIKVSKDVYIRQIKKKWYSRWKIAATKKDVAITFTKEEVKGFQHYGTFDIEPCGDGKNMWKWDKYKLI